MSDRKVIKIKDSTAGNPYEVIHILSDLNRMQILRLLSEHGELCARDILSYFPITQPTLSHHMNVLLDNHLVEARKSGRWVFYHLSQNGIQEIINFFEALKSASHKSEESAPQKITSPAQNRIAGRNMAMRPAAARARSKLSAKPAADPAKAAAVLAKPAKSAKPEKSTKPEETPAGKGVSGDRDRPSEFSISKKDKKKDKNPDKDKSAKKEKKKKKNKKK